MKIIDIFKAYLDEIGIKWDLVHHSEDNYIKFRGYRCLFYATGKYNKIFVSKSMATLISIKIYPHRSQDVCEIDLSNPDFGEALIEFGVLKLPVQRKRWPK